MVRHAYMVGNTMNKIKYPFATSLAHLFSGILLFILTGQSGYTATPSLDQLIEMVKSQQDKEAFQIASSLRSEYEGDPRFDFWYGVAAINTGNISEGIFALERVQQQYPQDDAVRMHLGRAYYLLEEDERARREFEQVLQHGPSESVQQTAERFLDAINNRQGRYRRDTQAWLQAGLGYDSNISSGPSGTTYPPWSLPLSGTEQSDMFGSLGIGGSYSQPLNPTAQFSIEGQLENRSYEDGDFDNTEAALRADLELRRDTQTWGLFLKGQNLYVDGDRNRRVSGGGLEWRNDLGSATELNAFLHYSDLEYPDQAVRNSDLTSIGLGFRQDYSGAWSPRLFATLYYGKQDADAATTTAKALTERKIKGLRGGVQLGISSDLNLYGVLSAENSRYGADYPLSSVPRDDTYYSLQLGGSWYLDKNWSLKAELRPTWNDSNLGIMEFDRTEASMHLRYDFR